MRRLSALEISSSTSHALRKKTRRLHLELLEARSLLTAAPLATGVSVQDVLAPAGGVSPAVGS
jgi:hypothetical protein